ncbi:MAG: hypothetical protein HYX75_13680 [Acidobacteria bacterium]|nr:hypothetical protein [Acidobacteriota bacterium]
MSIDLDARRIALSSPEGPPVRGDVSTDLTPGFYTLRVDRDREEWVFAAGEVKVGLRFHVALEGAGPFELDYPPSLPLVAQHGFQRAGVDSFTSAKGRVVRAVSDRQYADAFAILDLLGEVDLYDLLDELWLDEPGVVNELLLTFEKVLATKQFEMFRLLRALENFAVDKKKLYVDAFDRCFVHPTSFSRDKEREKLGKTNTKLVFTYALTPARAVIIYADDIYDSQEKSDDRPQYGEGGLLYPRFCTAATTPRIHAEKKRKLVEIESQNLEFIKTAFSAVDKVVSMVVVASGLMLRTLPEIAAAGRSPRPISDAVEQQPGQWLRDLEGGLNMPDEAAAYQSRVCHADQGWGYYRNGVQFDGYERGTLLDAKFYPDGSGMSRSLASNSYRAGNRALEQAARQLKAAGNIPIQWRVAGEIAARQLQTLFRVNKVPITVVFVP